jgi:hypothetical protein
MNIEDGEAQNCCAVVRCHYSTRPRFETGVDKIFGNKTGSVCIGNLRTLMHNYLKQEISKDNIHITESAIH